MERDSLLFYKSFYDAIKELDPADQAACYDAIFRYAFHGEEVELTGICKAIFLLIKPQIDANNQKYLNGLKGGRPKEEEKTKEKPKQNQKRTEAKRNENVNDNVNENDKENVNEKDNVSVFFNSASAPEKEKSESEQFMNPEVDSRFERFKAMRLEKGKSLKADSEKIIKDKIVKFSKGDPVTAAKIIDQAIEGGYLTVIPLQKPPEQKKDDSGPGFAQHDYDMDELRRRAKA